MINKFLLMGLGLIMFAGSAAAADRLPVFVSIVPQQTFVQEIGKDLVDVQVMVPPGADPHTYEPSPQQMVALAKARLYFAVGIEFEAARLPKLASANSNLKVVHTDRAVPKISMTAHPHSLLPGRQAERPPPASHDDHHGLDPHIWLSPARVKIQAEAIAAALQAADPAHRSAYQANSQEFYTALEALDEELKTAFAGRQGRRFMVFHPSWGYFAHDYGLQQVSIQIEGKDPKPAQLQKLIEHARQNRIKVVFVQPQFSAKSAEMIAREIDGRVVVADPMARDWFANIRAVARAFQAALE